MRLFIYVILFSKFVIYRITRRLCNVIFGIGSAALIRRRPTSFLFHITAVVLVIACGKSVSVKRFKLVTVVVAKVIIINMIAFLVSILRKRVSVRSFVFKVFNCNLCLCNKDPVFKLLKWHLLMYTYKNMLMVLNFFSKDSHHEKNFIPLQARLQVVEF